MRLRCVLPLFLTLTVVACDSQSPTDQTASPQENTDGITKDADSVKNQDQLPKTDITKLSEAETYLSNLVPKFNLSISEGSSEVVDLTDKKFSALLKIEILSVTPGLKADLVEGRLMLAGVSGYSGQGKVELKIATIEKNRSQFSISAALIVEVLPINDPPLAQDTVIKIETDAKYTALLRATDPDNDPLTYELMDVTDEISVDLDKNTGTLIISSTQIPQQTLYTFKVTDPSGSSSAAKLILDYTSFNTPPVGSDMSLQIDEDQPLFGTIQSYDQETPESLLFELKSNVKNGQLVNFNAVNGSFTYLGNQNFHGKDSFKYVISDGVMQSTEYTITIDILSVNDAPTVTNIVWDSTIVRKEDEPVHFRVIATDVDSTTLRFAEAMVSSHGTINGTYPDLTYTPYRDYFGEVSIEIRVSDGISDSTPSTIYLQLISVNDMPTGMDTTANTEEDTLTTVTLFSNDVDDTFDNTKCIISSSVNLTITKIPRVNGSLYGRDCRINIQPKPNFNGAATFSYSVSDNKDTSSNYNVTVNVGASNDAPVGSSAASSSEEDTEHTLHLAGNDPDSESLTWEVSGFNSSKFEYFYLTASTGELRFKPATNFSGTINGTYKVGDSQLWSTEYPITLTILPVNDSPKLTVQSNMISSNEDAAVSFSFGITDVDSTNPTIEIVQTPNKGNLVINTSTMTGTYTPFANENGSDEAVIQAVDSLGARSVAVSISINITPVNDAPIVHNFLGSLREDFDFNGQLLFTDIDSPSSEVTFALIETTKNGSLTLLSSGAFLYKPGTNFNGTDTFSYKVSDGLLDSHPATATLTINAVNDKPEVQPFSLITDEDNQQSHLGWAVLKCYDADGDNCTYFAIISPPKNGTASIAGNIFYYKSATNFFGTDTVTIITRDNQLASEPYTVQITVNPTPDLPIPQDVTFATQEGEELTGKVQFTDPDGPDEGHVFTVNDQYNEISIDNETGVFKFKPLPDSYGTRSFYYTVADEAEPFSRRNSGYIRIEVQKKVRANICGTELSGLQTYSWKAIYNAIWLDQPKKILVSSLTWNHEHILALLQCNGEIDADFQPIKLLSPRVPLFEKISTNEVLARDTIYNTSTNTVVRRLGDLPNYSSLNIYLPLWENKMLVIDRSLGKLHAVQLDSLQTTEISQDSSLLNEKGGYVTGYSRSTNAIGFVLNNHNQTQSFTIIRTEFGFEVRKRLIGFTMQGIQGAQPQSDGLYFQSTKSSLSRLVFLPYDPEQSIGFLEGSGFFNNWVIKIVKSGRWFNIDTYGWESPDVSRYAVGTSAAWDPYFGLEKTKIRQTEIAIHDMIERPDGRLFYFGYKGSFSAISILTDHNGNY